MKIKKKQEILKFLKQKSESQSNRASPVGELRAKTRGFSQQINETLFVLFYSSPPRNREQKKQTKISGFSFLHYLFDNPYFIYNNYTPTYKPLKTSVVPSFIGSKNYLAKSPIHDKFYQQSYNETNNLSWIFQGFWENKFIGRSRPIDKTSKYKASSENVS